MAARFHNAETNDSRRRDSSVLAMWLLLPTVGGFLRSACATKQLAAEHNPAWHLKADIKRAQDIRENIPAIQKDCDLFEQSLFPA